VLRELRGDGPARKLAEDEISSWEENYCGFIQVGPARSTRKTTAQWRPDDRREDIDKRSLELNDEILICRRACDIFAVYERSGAEFGPVNGSTALHRLAKMPDRDAASRSPLLVPLASHVLALLQ